MMEEVLGVPVPTEEEKQTWETFFFQSKGKMLDVLAPVIARWAADWQLEMCARWVENNCEPAYQLHGRVPSRAMKEELRPKHTKKSLALGDLDRLEELTGTRYLQLREIVEAYEE